MKPKLVFCLPCLFLLLIAAIASFGQTSPQLLSVCPKSDQCGFIDYSGKIVIKSTFIDTGDFSEGLASVKVKTKEGEKLWFHKL